MEQRAVCLQKVPVTGGAVQLAPGSAAGMPVGTEIAPAHPAPIGAVWIRAEMSRGVHLARASPAGDDRRRGGGWQSSWSLCRLLTGRTVRLPGETRKRLRVAGAFVRWRKGLGCPLIPCGVIAWPYIVEHDTQPQEAQQQQLIEKQVRYHGKVPLTRLRKGGILPDFQATKLPAGWRYTTVQTSARTGNFPWFWGVYRRVFTHFRLT